MKNCFLFFHNWSNWIDVERGSILAGKPLFFGDTKPEDMMLQGFYVKQERRCGRCNKIEIKVVKS